MLVAVDIALLFFAVVGVCLAVVVWDISRRKLEMDGQRQTIADLQLRVSELVRENRSLRDELGFMDKLRRSPGPEG